jgi:flagellar basal-body rod protein FlgC
MGMFEAMNASASGLTAHRLWMDVIASNLANAESTRSAAGGPFRRQMLVMSADGTDKGVKVDTVTPDPSPSRQVYDPGHPDADASGMVSYPNVDPVREMVDMMTASRAFEANAVAMTTTKAMMLRALEIGKT